MCVLERKMWDKSSRKDLHKKGKSLKDEIGKLWKLKKGVDHSDMILNLSPFNMKR